MKFQNFILFICFLSFSIIYAQDENLIVDVNVSPAILYNGDQIEIFIEMNLDNVELDWFDFFETQHFRYSVYEDENLSIQINEIEEIDTGIDSGIWEGNLPLYDAIDLNFYGERYKPIYIVIDQSFHNLNAQWELLSKFKIYARNLERPDPNNGVLFDEYAEAAFIRNISFKQIQDEIEIMYENNGSYQFPWGTTFQFIWETNKSILNISDVAQLLDFSSPGSLVTYIGNNLFFDDSPFEFDIYESIQNSIQTFLDGFISPTYLEVLVNHSVYSNFKNCELFAADNSDGISGLLEIEEDFWINQLNQSDFNYSSVISVLNDQRILLENSNNEISNLINLQWTEIVGGSMWPPPPVYVSDLQTSVLLELLKGNGIDSDGYVNEFGIRINKTLRTDDLVEFIEMLENDNVYSGCTDPNAINYNPENTADDGSCICSDGYATIDFTTHEISNNEVGFSQTCFYQEDLDFLQAIINNSSETLVMEFDMDENGVIDPWDDFDVNGNGVIDPIELGWQGWWNGRLKVISASYQGLSGEFPPEIGNTELEFIWITNQELTGFSPEIGNVNSLNFIWLYNNEFLELPSEFGNLTNLTTLNLGKNQLTSIPETIGNLSELQNLQLFSNQLTMLPESICNLNMSFYGGDNFLCGYVPECILNSDGFNKIIEYEPGDMNYIESPQNCEWYFIGDINQDEIINIVDIVLLVSFILGQQSLDQFQELNSDTNIDGIINVIDIVQLVNIILNN